MLECSRWSRKQFQTDLLFKDKSYLKACLTTRRIVPVANYYFFHFCTITHYHIEYWEVLFAIIQAGTKTEVKLRDPELFLFSAPTRAALATQLAAVGSYVQTHPNANQHDVAFSLAKTSASEGWRYAAVNAADDSLSQQLFAASTKQTDFTHLSPTNKPITFFFPGVGDHYVGMARQLMQSEPVFRRALEQCNTIFTSVLSHSIFDLLYPSEADTVASAELDLRALLGRGKTKKADSSLINQTKYAHPIVFSVEYALVQLLASWGLKAAALCGYSLGEYVAAVVAGVLSLEDGLLLVIRRAELIDTAPAGRMLAVSLPLEQARRYISADISLSAHNAQDLCVLSGDVATMEQLRLDLLGQNIACRLLETTHAFHSHMLQPLAEKLTSLVAEMPLNAPRTPIISNVTGTWLDDETATNPSYWAKHMCQPVQFYQGLRTLLQRETQIFLEVGPGQSLGSFAKQHTLCSGEQMKFILPTLRYSYDPQSDSLFLLEVLGKLWLAGVDIRPKQGQIISELVNQTSTEKGKAPALSNKSRGQQRRQRLRRRKNRV